MGFVVYSSIEYVAVGTASDMPTGAISLKCDLGSAVDQVASLHQISNSYAIFGNRAFRKN